MADRFQMLLDNKQIEQGRAALARLTPEQRKNVLRMTVQARKMKHEATANAAKKGASE